MKFTLGNKLSVSFKNFRGSKLDLRYLFLIILLCTFALDAWVGKAEVDMVLTLQNQQIPAPKGAGVRVDFDNYNKIVQRIQQADSFVPTGGITKNPFAPSQPDNISPQPVSGSSSSNGLLQLH